MPFEAYLKRPEISKSALDRFAKSPQKFRRYKDGLIKDEPTWAMTEGRLVHALVLEEREDFIVRPSEYTNEDGDVKPWNANAKVCRAWEKSQTLKPVSESQAESIRKMAQAILSEPKALEVLAGCQNEMSAFCDDDEYGLRLKGRPDALNLKSHMADVKKIKDASEEGLSRAIHFSRYHVQAAHYLRIMDILGHTSVKAFYFIAVEDSDLPEINVRRLTNSAIRRGQEILEKELELLSFCFQCNKWPGYSGDTEEIKEIDIPAYGYGAEDALTLKIGGEDHAL